MVFTALERPVEKVKATSLLLKVSQSVSVRQPKVEVSAVSQAKSSPVRVRPAPPVRLVSDEISILVPRSTLKELPEYVSPVPAVVVAALYTRPPVVTASPPVERDERRRSVVMVEEAVERKPFKKPRVVEVETPHVVGVQAKGVEVLSSVSQPKIPPVQVTKDPEAQVVRPKPLILVPKRLVVEAVVAKRLVVVA
jgi:hypothetical protein